MENKKEKKLSEVRKKVFERDIIHSPEFMKKHLPKSGSFLNRFQFVKIVLGSGVQEWTCDYIHLVFPGYRKVVVKLDMRIIARASKWKEFTIKLTPPADLDEVEKIRIQRDVSEYVRYILIRHLGRYF